MMTATLTVVMTTATAARATIITNAALRAAGDFVELRFDLRGRGLVWHLRENRQQLIIDFEQTRIALASRPFAGREVAPIRAVAVADTGSGAARIVIDVDGKVDYAAGVTGRELIIRFARAGTAPNLVAGVDLHDGPGRTPARIARKDTAVFSAADPAPAATVPAPAVPVALAEPRPQNPRPLVVIDPGHGGRDPGTRSDDGVSEKDLALQIAARLQRVLEGAGVAAELTRNDDRFLSLGERTAIANRDHAALFVSIHLNSSPDVNTTGIGAYYLNNTTDRATIRLARMENGAAEASSDRGEPNLNYVLTDLRQGYKANEAVALAQMIETESVAAADAQGFGLRALGAMQGPFYVLVGAEMPSVLVECGFLSNPDEARRLSAPRYQAALADGIGAAVIHYLEDDEAVGNL
ncbi:MAG TPA: N-acetylmuramoyl-L-alanine amidase [Candidatus Binataceae bacterium]|nr:N-acetylmuramoyl-L-alanine amidase [Candidatus Binataceae bacterium]